MVRAGTAKKRRRGGKVSRKSQPNKHKQVRSALRVHEFKDKWDDKKNATENLRSFGLVADPNEDLAGRNRKRTTASGEVPFVKFVHVPVSDALNQIDEQNPRRRVMSEEDQKYCAALLKRHGQDYTAMARDIKTNVLQLPEQRLKKMCSRFLLLDSRQRLIPIPENVAGQA